MSPGANNLPTFACTNIAIASACAIAAATSQAMYQKLRSHHYWTPQSGERITATPGQTICTMCRRAIYRHAHPLAADIARRANDLESCLREMEVWLVTLLPPMNPFLRQSVYAVLQRRTLGNHSCLRQYWQCTDSIATMAGAIAGAWRGFDGSLKINMPFSAP